MHAACNNERYTSPSRRGNDQSAMLSTELGWRSMIHDNSSFEHPGDADKALNAEPTTQPQSRSATQRGATLDRSAQLAK